MLADVLKEIQEKDNVVCARFGGDEFIMICNGYEYEGVAAIAREIGERVASAAMKHEYSGASDVVTVSLGICYGVPEPHQRLNDFIHVADSALYEVKASGRCGCRVFGEEEDRGWRLEARD